MIPKFILIDLAKLDHSIDVWLFSVISNFSSFKTLAIQSDLDCVFFTNGSYSWIFEHQQFFSIVCLCLFVLFFSFIRNDLVEVLIWVFFLLVGGIFWILEVQNSLQLFNLTHEGALLYFLARANRFCYICWDKPLDQWVVKRWISVVGFLIYCLYVWTASAFSLDIKFLALMVTGITMSLFTCKTYYLHELELVCTKKPWTASSFTEKPLQVFLPIFLLGWVFILFFYGNIHIFIFFCSALTFGLPLVILFGVFFSNRFEVLVIKVVNFFVKKNTFVFSVLCCSLVLVQFVQVDAAKVYFSLLIGINWTKQLLLCYNQQTITALQPLLCCGAGKVKLAWDTVGLVSRVAVLPAVLWGLNKVNNANIATRDEHRLMQFRETTKLLDQCLAEGSIQEDSYRTMYNDAFKKLPSNDKITNTSTFNVGIFSTSTSSQSSNSTELSNKK